MSNEQEMREAFEFLYATDWDDPINEELREHWRKAWQTSTLAAEETFNQRLVELTSRIRELEADAKRYRWLRSDDIEWEDGMPYVAYDMRMLTDLVTIPLTETELDEAIDKSMSAHED